MASKKTFRYPGTQPFTVEQKDLFHGRKQELEDLLKMIRFQQTVVLYGKSGLGKSSLLNAAIAPEVANRRIADTFFVRFNAWTGDQDSHETPLSKTFRLLMPDSAGELAPLASGDSLWFAAKARQLQEGRHRFLLVFDQFEELFTYPEEQIIAFKEELAELLRASLPQRFEKTVGQLALSDEALESLYEPAEIKALFAIRSDRMHLLDKLSDLLPNILRHSFELQALTLDDARSAIEEPARAAGNFDSPPFGYEQEALAQILRFLQDDDGRVEAIQLQTLCQAFERKMAAATPARNALVKAADTQEATLKNIIEDYYLTQLKDPGLGDHADIARRLIEEELVIETEGGKGVRVTMHELSLFAKFGAALASGGNGKDEQAGRLRLHSLLDALVNLHLLRREVGARGGDTYELAHDRLIAPVLAGKKERLAAEAEAEHRRAEEETRRQLADERRKRQQTRRVAAGLGVLSLVSLLALGGAWWQYRIADQAKTDAEQKRLEAEKATKTAVNAQLRADSLATAAQRNAAIAEEQRNAAQRNAAQRDAALVALKKIDAERRRRVAVEIKKYLVGARRMRDLNNLEEARSMLREALALDPGNAEVLDAMRALGEK